MPYVVLGVAVTGVAAALIAGPAVVQRLTTILTPRATQGKTALQRGNAQGEALRVQFWGIALGDGFLRHPVAGIGVGDMGQFIQNHSTNAGIGVRAGTAQYANAASTYFQLIGEAGLFAIALFGLVFTGLARDLRAGLRAYPVLGAGLAGAAVALLVCWVTDVVVYYEPVAACAGVLFGAVAAAGRAGRDHASDAPVTLA
jgi:hypothetical protein